MERSQLVKGLIGSMLIGAGIAVMISAARRCDQGEGILEEVAGVSAEMAGAGDDSEAASAVEANGGDD